MFGKRERCPEQYIYIYIWKDNELVTFKKGAQRFARHVITDDQESGDEHGNGGGCNTARRKVKMI